MVFNSLNFTGIFQQMQSMEENRINKIKSMVKQIADIERSVIPIINTCIDGMVKASDGISAEEVYLLQHTDVIQDSSFFYTVLYEMFSGDILNARFEKRKGVMVVYVYSCKFNLSSICT